MCESLTPSLVCGGGALLGPRFPPRSRRPADIHSQVSLPRGWPGCRDALEEEGSSEGGGFKAVATAVISGSKSGWGTRAGGYKMVGWVSKLNSPPLWISTSGVRVRVTSVRVISAQGRRGNMPEEGYEWTTGATPAPKESAHPSIPPETHT